MGGIGRLSIIIMTVVLIGFQYAGLDPHHAHWWDYVPGFWALFGLVGCWIIVVGSKKLGKAFIQRKEDYYGDS